MRHYIRKNLQSFFIGIAIGTAAIIPGISGGTIAVLFKIYDKIIHAVNSLTKDFKTSIFFLLPIFIGVGVAILSLTFPITLAFESFPLPTVSIFAGLIIGGLKPIRVELPKKIKTSQWFVFFITFLIASLLGVFSVLSGLDGTEILVGESFLLKSLLIIIGMLGVSAFVIPGISGSMLMLSLGFYLPILELIKSFLSFDFSIFEFISLGMLGVGALLGFFIISKLMAILLLSYRPSLFVGILGFVLGSIVSIYINYEIVHVYQNLDGITLFISLLSLLGGFFVSRKLEELV
jgi:putative membrane protein